MFIVTALVAVAAYLAKLGVAGPDHFCLLAVAPLLGAAIGVLLSNVKGWIFFGVWVDSAALGLILVWLLIETGFLIEPIGILLSAAALIVAVRDLRRLARHKPNPTPTATRNLEAQRSTANAAVALEATIKAAKKNT
jgi:hypothetical protein